MLPVIAVFENRKQTFYLKLVDVLATPTERKAQRSGRHNHCLQTPSTKVKTCSKTSEARLTCSCPHSYYLIHYTFILIPNQ